MYTQPSLEKNNRVPGWFELDIVPLKPTAALYSLSERHPDPVSGEAHVHVGAVAIGGAHGDGIAAPFARRAQAEQMAAGTTENGVRATFQLLQLKRPFVAGTRASPL
jgi:hypothetical protein